MQGEGRGTEEGFGADLPALRVSGEQHRTELTELDDDVARTFFQQALTGKNQIRGAGEFARFALVDDKQVQLAEHIVQALVGDVDPQIHGIGNDETRRCGASGEHLQLVVR